MFLLVSGGQKVRFLHVAEERFAYRPFPQARVSLARAVYSSGQILLVDDILSALDVHTARSIVDDCFGGDLVRGRTVILVVSK